MGTGRPSLMGTWWRVFVVVTVGLFGYRVLVDKGGDGSAPTSSASAARVIGRVRSSAATSIDGTYEVSHVIDGDTLVLADGRSVRLAQVDAPETGACFGSASTAALKRLADGEEVKLRRPAGAPKKDHYGRTLAEVIVDGKSVDEELIRDGAARWYSRFGPEDPDLARRLQAAEHDARERGRGLWAACRRAA